MYIYIYYKFIYINLNGHFFVEHIFDYFALKKQFVIRVLIEAISVIVAIFDKMTLQTYCVLLHRCNKIIKLGKALKYLRKEHEVHFFNL